MFGPREPSERTRFVLIAAFMIAALLASVGAAWWLTRSRNAPHRRGEEILQRIRREGLEKFWPGPQTRWYLRQRSGKPVGWRLVARDRDADGLFHGVRVSVRADGGMGAGFETHWEQWTLNAAADEGSYEAGQYYATRTKRAALTDTVIHLRAGQIDVVQLIAGEPFDSDAVVPGNYAPEGTLGLVRRLVARDKTTATFRLVFNSVPPSGRGTRLATAEMRYAGEGKPFEDRPTEQVIVLSHMGGAGDERAYDFDAGGELVRIRGKESQEVAASVKRILSHFPGALTTVRRLHAVRKWKIRLDAE